MKKIFVIFLCILTTACASYRPVNPSLVANPLPNEATDENSVQIVVMRNSAFAGGAIDAYLYFDDEFIVTLERAQTYTFYTTPGEHKISATAEHVAVFSPNTKRNNVLVENFSPNQTYTYLLKPKSHGGGFAGHSMEILLQQE